MDANSCTESPVLSTIMGDKTKSACGTAVLCLIDAEVTDPVVRRGSQTAADAQQRTRRVCI